MTTVIKHKITKTITESDNNIFCLLTMNPNPLHLDVEYANKQKHQERLVVGTYILSLAVGISVLDLSFNAIANLSYNDIQHHRPVFIGDTLCFQSSIINISYTKTKKIVTVLTEGFNQDNLRVISFFRRIMYEK